MVDSQAGTDAAQKEEWAENKLYLTQSPDTMLAKRISAITNQHWQPPSLE